MRRERRGVAFATYMGPLLDALRLLGDSAHRSEAKEKTAELMGIPAEKLAERYEKTGVLVVHNQMAWAASGLRAFGFIGGAAKGVWTLTEAGRNKHLTLEQANELAREWNARRRQESIAGRVAEADDADEQEADSGPEEEVQADTTQTLLQVLQSLSAGGFERLSQLLLRKAGFTKVVVTGRSGDGGIDGHGILELNELLSFRVLFQCKKYAGTVGSGAVRDFRGAMTGRSDKGIIITTGTFSAEAEREAIRDGAPPVELVDGERLFEMMQRLELGVEPKTVYVVNTSFFEQYK